MSNPPELVLQPYRSDPQARTNMGGGPTTLYFINYLPKNSVAHIKKIDEQGNRTLAATILHGNKSLVMPTYPHQPWEVIFSDQRKETVRMYYAAPVPCRINLDMDLLAPNPYLPGMHISPSTNSPQGGAYTTIKFENHLQHNSVKISSVDSVGQLVPRGTIRPGGSSVQSTYVGHIWKVFLEHATSPFIVFKGSLPGGVASIVEELLHEQVSQ